MESAHECCEWIIRWSLLYDAKKKMEYDANEQSNDRSLMMWLKKNQMIALGWCEKNK